MERSENITKLLTALIKAQSQMGNAIKDSRNPYYNNNYADLNSLRAEALPHLYANGLTILQPPTTFQGKNYIETILAHESGEFISSLNEVIVAKDKDPQSYLAAQTYTRRGAFQAVLCMGAEDDDGNFASGKTNKLEVTKASSSKNSAEPPKKTDTQAKAEVATKIPSFTRNTKPAKSDDLDL